MIWILLLTIACSTFGFAAEAADICGPNQDLDCSLSTGWRGFYCHKETQTCTICSECVDEWTNADSGCSDVCAGTIECSDHEDCSGSQWCSGNHQCNSCNTACVLDSSIDLGPIDGSCPAKCCGPVWRLDEDRTSFLIRPCSDDVITISGHFYDEDTANFEAIKNNLDFISAEVFAKDSMVCDGNFMDDGETILVNCTEIGMQSCGTMFALVAETSSDGSTFYEDLPEFRSCRRMWLRFAFLSIGVVACGLYCVFCCKKKEVVAVVEVVPVVIVGDTRASD